MSRAIRAHIFWLSTISILDKLPFWYISQGLEKYISVDWSDSQNLNNHGQLTNTRTITNKLTPMLILHRIIIGTGAE